MKEQLLVDIRYSQFEDGDFLRRWLEDPETNRWFPMSTTDEIEKTSKNWMSFFRLHSSLTALIDNKPVAIGTLFLLPYKKVSHQCSFYLVVAPGMRRKGIGTSMIKNLLNLARNYFHFESIYAEIYEGSVLRQMLQPFGFEEIAYQERFVKDQEGYRARIILEHMFQR